jgi:26S proteasome regulatory subunit N3
VSISLLERAVSSLEPRFATRALRKTSSYRHALSLKILEKQLQAVSDGPLKQLLSTTIKVKPLENKQEQMPEVEIFLGLVVVLFLLDQKQMKQVFYINKGKELSLDLIQRSKKLNRRTLDPIQAKLFFYYSLFSQQDAYEIQHLMITSHRTATLRQDNDTQATLMNIILKNYLDANLIDQADKFIQKAGFPEQAGNNQLARYMYYIGRIKAIQLDYSVSHRNILQAIRKAPQTDATIGFQQTTQKLSIIVQLLMGEIPERSLFHQVSLAEALKPYFHITQAVRSGDLSSFQETLTKYSDVFHADKNMTLILRYLVINSVYITM